MSTAFIRVLLFKVALCAALVYIGLCVLLYLLQDKILFPASRVMDRDPSVYGWAFDEVRLPVVGEETFGWYVPLENHRGVVLFSHGNAGDLAGRLESIGMLRSFGFSVLAYDYGGYGYSTGKPSETRCYADIRAMWDYLIEEREIEAKDILIFGRSLGGGPTAELAQHVIPGAVILESTFMSTADVARRNPLLRTMTWAIRHRFASKDKVAKIKAPLLIIHSPDDEIIPFENGQGLFERATEPKTLLEIEGGHNTGFVTSEAIYRPGWEDFLTPVFGVSHSQPKNR
ncbi:MAG: lysophospholipase [Candidatus Hydrogenedentes bacterium]|nr:lysophospholipase [Candidatus Hydrogenedentota bacterium]